MNLNLTSGEWHHIENASNGGLRFSLGDTLGRCQDDFAEAIRQELDRRTHPHASDCPIWVNESCACAIGKDAK